MTDVIGYTARRTDADRRPHVAVARPNDGPGSIERRYQLSEEIRQRVENKLRRLRCEETSDEARARLAVFHRKMILVALIENGPMLMSSLAVAAGIEVGSTSLIGSKMEAEGLITREVIGTNSKAPTRATITDLGRAYIEAASQ
jgi:DNA-binding MarR family transcriptional regulator